MLGVVVVLSVLVLFVAAGSNCVVLAGPELQRSDRLSPSPGITGVCLLVTPKASGSKEDVPSV